ncbi:hypothetical protein XENOCAPTIV_011406 [Xenoophorus captivus]|uniref:Uncharacterized protein n=1 Tax=Xenoophorus captivus TaxID=1517983 RepID=A0ABV0SEN1_9TELE
MEEKGAREKNTGAAKVQSPGVEHSELQNEDRNSAILHKLRGLRKEHADVVGENKRVLANMKELMDRTSSLEHHSVRSCAYAERDGHQCEGGQIGENSPDGGGDHISHKYFVLVNHTA